MSVSPQVYTLSSSVRGLVFAVWQTLLLCLLLLLVSTRVMAIDLTDEEQAYLKDKQRLTVLGLSSFPPFSFVEDGRLQGYTVEYMRLVGKALGVEIDFVTDKPWFESLQMLKEGKLDVIPSIAVSEERLAFVDYTPYSHIEYTSAMVTRKLNPGEVLSLQDKIVAVTKNTFLHDYIRQHYPNVALLVTPSTRRAVLAVANGRADIAVGSLPSLNYYIQKSWLSNLQVSRVAGFELPGHTALPMGVTKGNSLLRGLLQKADTDIAYADVMALKKRWMYREDLVEGVAGLTVEEAQFLANRARISICVDPDWMPLEAIDQGVHTGISADFLALMGAKLGVEFHLISSDSWQESLDLGRQGVCDLFPLIMKTQPREAFLSFTQPYLHTPLVLVTDIQAAYMTDMTKLEGKRVGVANGYAFSSELKAQYPQITFIDVKNIADGLEQVRDGKLFGYIDSLIASGYWIQSDYNGQLKISGEVNKTWQLAMGVQKSLQPLVGILDKVIRQTPELERQEIINKWVSIRYQKGTNWWVTVIGVLATMLVLGAVIAWYVRLSRRLEKEVLLRIEAEQTALNLAHTDQLTGILNRHGSDELIRHEMARAKRLGGPVCLMILDIDHFKLVNDEHGHKVGDDVLKLLAKTLGGHMRETDHFVRWGGEEFLILVADTPLDTAQQLAEKFRALVDQLKQEGLPHFTVSIGVAQFIVSESFSQWYQRTDAALYEAKNSGRNRVVIADDTLPALEKLAENG